jgi:hypothetical protein
MHAHQTFAGTAEDHAQEALGAHVVVGERGLVNLCHGGGTGDLDVGAPSGIDILAPLEGINVDGLQQFLPLPLQLAEQLQRRFLLTRRNTTILLNLQMHGHAHQHLVCHGDLHRGRST